MAQKKETFALFDGGVMYQAVAGLEAVPVRVWEKDAEGKARQTDRQERRAGVPLWEKEVLVQKLYYGAPVAELVKVRYASEDGSLPAVNAPSYVTEEFFSEEGAE